MEDDATAKKNQASNSDATLSDRKYSLVKKAQSKNHSLVNEKPAPWQIIKLHKITKRLEIITFRKCKTVCEKASSIRVRQTTLSHAQTSAGAAESLAGCL